MNVLLQPRRVPVNTLDLLLKTCYSAPACWKPSFRRQLSMRPPRLPPPDVQKVAILGGGITGLVSAYYLSKCLPNVQIALFEGSSRLGGWLHSSKVDVGTGQVIFEQGPRNLRPSFPNGLFTLDLVRDLGMEDSLLMTSKNSVAAQNRFVYYPDHLVRMPGQGSIFSSISTILNEPIFSGVVPDILKEAVKPPRSEDLKDESVGSFISRRFGSTLADNVISAVFHGIYAGDIYKLSAQTIMPALWHTEARNGAIMRGLTEQFFSGLRPTAIDDEPLSEFRNREEYPPHGKLDQARKSSVFTFKRGVGELATKLEEKLYGSPNVTIHKRSLVDSLKLKFQTAGSVMEFTTRDARSRKSNGLWEFSHVIATIAGSKLADLVQNPRSLSHLKQTSAVTVMVVNIFYANPSILPVHGFGYLLPRTIPFDQNPEQALGVVFDSDASIGQDAIPGTKVTVMLGGHWWDNLQRFPDEVQGARMAKAVLKRHLNIDDEPQAVRVGLQKDCIPQYSVGHDDRMEKVHFGLKNDFSGRLRVAGSSYTGVGLNDCVRAARDVVGGLIYRYGRNRYSGLDSFEGGRRMVWAPPEGLKAVEI